MATLARCLCGVLFLAALCAGRPATAGERCGPRQCADGSVCCNDSCGICVAPGQACIQPDCGWGPDRVGGRRPILALDHPGALLGPRLGAQGGLGYGDGASGGQLRAATAWPLGAQLRLRAALDVALASVTPPTGTAPAMAVGRDGAVQSDVGLAYNLPLGTTWLQAAVLVDGVWLQRRAFGGAAMAANQRTWRFADLELAPGLAFVAQRWFVAVAGFVRAAHQLACADGDCRDSALRLWDAGLSLDADGRGFGVPMGVLAHGRWSADASVAGLGLFWLGDQLRLGAEVRRPFAAALGGGWPAVEWNLRVDWLAAER